MEITLKAGDSLQIPEGYKAIVKGESVEIEKAQKFKDGDVLVVVIGNVECPFIFFKASNGFCYYHFMLRPNGEINRSWFFNISILEYARHATELEKQLLFYTLKENGYQWNAEEKQVEKTRWRAKYGERYFTTTIFGQPHSFYERNDEYDKTHYDAYAYFHTEEQAEEAARRVKETLRKYHEEIGE